MMKIKIGFCFFVLLCFALNGCAAKKDLCKDTALDAEQEFVGYVQPDIQEQILPPLGKLIPGERLHFRVSWLGLNVGQATLEVKDAGMIDKKKAALVELTASSLGFFRLIYAVDGKVQSYVGLDDFRPIKYSSYTRINKKIIEKSMEYDFKALKVYAKDKKGEYELEVSDDVLDPLGVFYYFRRNPVVLDQPISLMVNGGKKNFPVLVYAVRERMFHVPAGRFWAFQVEPTAESERQFDDALNAEGSMRIWFSADDKRFPLQIILKVPVGSAVATLMSIEYLETELTRN